MPADAPLDLLPAETGESPAGRRNMQALVFQFFPALAERRGGDQRPVADFLDGLRGRRLERIALRPRRRRGATAAEAGRGFFGRQNEIPPLREKLRSMPPRRLGEHQLIAQHSDVADRHGHPSSRSWTNSGLVYQTTD